ncbi:hypothetical protein, partial [Aeromonas caviae]|uniref:hypothetical protein n=1 Tax=Aeromonas caviae TaxID=648 RepID=UPI001CC7E2EC
MSKNTMHSAGMPTTLEQANELIYKLLDRIAELEDRLIPIGLNIRSVLSNLGYKVTSPAPHRQ